MEDCFEVPDVYVNRTGCGVMDEMRKCYATRNFAPLLGLIEELQIAGNRMEAKLEDLKDLSRLRDKIKEARGVLKKLRAERLKLE